VTKIGDKLWRYNRDADNRMGRDGKMMDPWTDSYKITGESKTHWLVSLGHYNAKVNKKTLQESTRSGWGNIQWYTEAGMTERKWRETHAKKIAGLVTGQATVDQLKQIAKIVGYKETDQ